MVQVLNVGSAFCGCGDCGQFGYWDSRKTARHDRSCTNGCFSSERELLPWEIVRVRLPYASSRWSAHNKLILPGLPDMCSTDGIDGPYRVVPCLWISSHPPQPWSAGASKNLEIGPRRAGRTIRIKQIPWRGEINNPIHPREWRDPSFLIVHVPFLHPIKFFHKLDPSKNERAGLDRDSMTKVAEALERLMHKIDPLERVSELVDYTTPVAGSAAREAASGYQAGLLHREQMIAQPQDSSAEDGMSQLELEEADEPQASSWICGC